ncbi:MAG: ATP-binding cassette domain-containing protein, partial [Candidatus Eremiobacteraeota bacterium]|nr:ATP-binding cassette domain-containing protein [Candidatus Eremiobacteraeota bacterium]
MSLTASFAAQRDGFSLDFAIEVAPGETVAVVGPSGSGKTTALRCLAGLMRPQSGAIRYGDETWYDEASHVFVPAQRRNASMVFAKGALFGHLNVRENVEFGLQASGVDGEQRSARASEALRIVSAEHLADRRASRLSGGEVQRVALARAIALQPKVLLLDEPLSALDMRLRPLVREALRCAIAATNAATVFVAHDPAEAMLFAQRFVVVEDGVVAQSGSLDDLRNHPTTPYVASFAGTNLYRGQALGLGDGSSSVDIGGTRLVIQGDYEGEISILLDPDAVTISTAMQETSARNVLRGPVESIVPDRGAFRVTIASAPPISARVTARSLETLGVHTGQSLYA